MISLWSNTYIENTKIWLFESLSDAYISKFLWRVKPPVVSSGGSLCVRRCLFKRGRYALLSVGGASPLIKGFLKLSFFNTSDPTPFQFWLQMYLPYKKVFFLMQYLRVVSVCQVVTGGYLFTYLQWTNCFNGKSKHHWRRKLPTYEIHCTNKCFKN